MEIGIGLNDEYNFTLLFDFDFKLVSGADLAFRVEVEALLLALTDFDVLGFTIMAIYRLHSSTLLKTIDLIQLFDSIPYLLKYSYHQGVVPDDVNP